MPWSYSHRQLAVPSRSPPQDTGIIIPSEEQGCPRPLSNGAGRRPSGGFAGGDGAGGRQPGS